MRELVARLIGDAKTYAEAEFALVRRTAQIWFGAARAAALLLVAALVLALAGTIVLVAALGMAIAIWLGPAAGLAIAALLALMLAALLGWLAAKRFLGAVR